MAFRKRFYGSGLLFLHHHDRHHGAGNPAEPGSRHAPEADRHPAPRGGSTALGVHVVWDPAVRLPRDDGRCFNRFDGALEEAARDMGASEWTVFKEVTLPLITPGIVAAGPVRVHPVLRRVRPPPRCSRASTTPCRSTSTHRWTQRIRPTLFALGTASTLFSLLMIGFVPGGLYGCWQGVLAETALAPRVAPADLQRAGTWWTPAAYTLERDAEHLSLRNSGCVLIGQCQRQP